MAGLYDPSKDYGTWQASVAFDSLAASYAQTVASNTMKLPIHPSQNYSQLYGRSTTTPSPFTGYSATDRRAATFSEPTTTSDTVNEENRELSPMAERLVRRQQELVDLNLPQFQ